MAEAQRARALLAELEELALRTLAHETERLRRALEAADEEDQNTAEVARARMAALDALELYERSVGARSLAERQAQWSTEEGAP